MTLGEFLSPRAEHSTASQEEENCSSRQGLVQCGQRTISISPEERTALKMDGGDAYNRAYNIRFTRGNLLTFCGLFTIVILASTFAITNYVNNNYMNTCTTTSCVAAAATLKEVSQSSSTALALLNGSEDPRPLPCDDFYEYACGGWIENAHARVRGITEWNNIYQVSFEAFDAIHAIVGDISEEEGKTLPFYQQAAVINYQKCMRDNFDDMIKAFRLVEENVRGWCSTAVDDLTVEETLVNSYRMNAITMFSFSSLMNPRDNTMNSLTIEGAVPLIGVESAYSVEIEPDLRRLMKEESANGYMNILMTAGLDIARILDMDITPQFKLDLAKAIQFEQRLVLTGPTFHNDPKEDYELTLCDLSKMSGDAFHFYEFLRLFLGSPVSPESRILIAPGKRYLHRLINLLHEYNNEEGRKIIKDYIKLKQFVMIYVFSGQHTKKSEKEGLAGLDVLEVLYNRSPDRHIFCASRTGMSNQLGLINLMADRMGPRLTENVEKAKAIADVMREEYIQALTQSTLVDNEDDRERMIQKAKNARIRFGVPEASQDLGELEKETVARDGVNEKLPWAIYFTTVMGNKHQIKMMRVQEPINGKHWPAETNPFNVNVHYNRETNQILFSILMMIDQFVDFSMPTFYSYGGIGTFIIHEISHAFDPQGRLHGPTGLDGNLTSIKTSQNYDEKSKCIASQYLNLGDKRSFDLAVLAENVADNVAIDLAYKGWMKNDDMNGKILPGIGLSAEQAFFLSFAQSWCSITTKPSGLHSLERYRVMGPLQNSRAFSSAFSCPVGSKMNPVNKCSVW